MPAETEKTRKAHPKLVIKLPARPSNSHCRGKSSKARNRVFRAVPSIEELVNSKEENQALEDSPLAFPGGDHDIVEQVVCEGQVKQGEVEEEDSEEEDAPDPNAGLTRCEVVELVQ